MLHSSRRLDRYLPVVVLLATLFAHHVAQAQCVNGVNSALSFDGVNDSAYVAGAAPGTLDGFGDFTIELWAKTSSSNHTYFASNWNNPITADSPWVIATDTGGAGKLSTNLSNTSGSFSGNQVGSAVISDGSWHHIALTRSNRFVTAYVDGTVDKTYPFGGALRSTFHPMTVGVSLNNGVPALHLSGSVDELRIWNIYRTAAEINATKNVGLVGNEPGLVGYWRFDEGFGQTLYNSATATGSTLNGTRGSNALAGLDDPAYSSTSIAPLAYCSACPAAPCGQTNSPCATLTVNGVGFGAQGPLGIAVQPGSSLNLGWFGPAGQPYVLVATPSLVPGQLVAPPSFIVDVDVAAYSIVFSGFDPVFGPFYVTDGAGEGLQSWTVPGPAPLGVTLNVQGLVYDLGLTCGGGLPFMTTASFSIQL